MYKNINLLIIFIVILTCSAIAHSATLLECNWDVGTGTSSTVIKGGTFNSAYEDVDEYRVFSGGIGERNYLRIIAPSHGSGWIHGHTPFGNPTNLYIRFWMRFNEVFPNTVYHPMIIGPVTQPLTGNGTYFCRFARGNSGNITWSIDNYRRWNTQVNDGQWYMMEYKFTNNPGANDSIEVRIDGVDVTSSYKREVETGLNSLSDENGTLDLKDLNYIAFQTYDNPSGYDCVDIAALQVTDGPNWIGGDSFPSVNISFPTSATTYATSQDTIAISGNASDDDAISSITWSNNRGGSGTAINDSGDWTSWSIENIALLEGDNVITVTATDSADQTSSDTITVTSSDIAQAWNATEQTGDADWKNSGVTYCVRLLVEGAKVTQRGSQVMLGFQGRSSGDYTIRKVSIAEMDVNGNEGDVVDSTWTKVTFDGKTDETWLTDEIIIPQGTEKLSNPILFSIQPDKDYYVTFKIQTPSVYLNPPAFYRELYFSSADYTEDIDWSDNGHSITQDFHALSKIYVISGETPSVLSAPSGLKVDD